MMGKKRVSDMDNKVRVWKRNKIFGEHPQKGPFLIKRRKKVNRKFFKRDGMNVWGEKQRLKVLLWEIFVYYGFCLVAEIYG